MEQRHKARLLIADDHTLVAEACKRFLEPEFESHMKYPILHEENREKKVFLLWVTDFFRRQLERTAGVLGIEVPDYM